MAGCRLLAVLALAAALALGAAALPAACWEIFPSTRRAHRRACFANQELLRAAIRTRGPRPGLAKTLQGGLFLCEGLPDPGGGPGRTDHYVGFAGPDGSFALACVVHGRSEGDRRLSPMAQLEAMGVSDPVLLGRFGTTPVDALDPVPVLRLPLLQRLGALLLVPGVLAALAFDLMPAPMAIQLVVGLAVLGAWAGLRALRLLGAGLGRALWRGAARAGDPARCPVCFEGIAGPGRPAACCPRCKTPHHEACRRYLGGCGVFGCAPVPGAGPRAAAAASVP